MKLAAISIVLGLSIVLLAPAQNSGEAEFARAMQFIAEGKFPQAEQSLRALEKGHPALFEIRYRLGVVLLRQGKFAEASSRLEAASKQSPDSAAAWLAVAQVRFKLGQRLSALEAAARAANLAGDAPPIWHALALLHSDAGGFATAVAFEERYVQASGANPSELHRLRAQAHRVAGDPAQAADEFQRAISAAPDRWTAYGDLAGMFLDHRTPEPALVLLDPVSGRFRRMAEYHHLLGLALYQTGNADKAIDSFLAIADLEPNSDLGYASLETLLADAGARRAEIAARLRGFRGRNPNNPVGHFLLARLLALEGAAQPEIEVLLRRAIAVEPKFWPAYYELAQVFETLSKNAEAVRLLNAAVRLNPEYAAAHFSLSRLYAKLGDRDLAVSHRKRHGELLDRQRAATARARAESPALSYRLGDAESSVAPAKER